MSSGGDPRKAAYKAICEKPGIKPEELTPYQLRGAKSLMRDGWYVCTRQGAYFPVSTEDLLR